MSFQSRVKSVPALRDGCRDGKQALKGEHRNLIECSNPRRFTGSVDLDTTLAQSDAHRHAKRWDYGIGLKEGDGHETAAWIEVHPANTGSIREMIGKLQWLKQYLAGEGACLGEITSSNSSTEPFVWIASGKVAFTANDPAARILAAHGLSMPRRKMVIV